MPNTYYLLVAINIIIQYNNIRYKVNSIVDPKGAMSKIKFKDKIEFRKALVSCF